MAGRRPEVEGMGKMDWAVSDNILPQFIGQQFGELSWCCLGADDCGAVADTLFPFGEFCMALDDEREEEQRILIKLIIVAGGRDMC